jgi:uncharacterized protein (TIGR00725 family)
MWNLPATERSCCQWPSSQSPHWIEQPRHLHEPSGARDPATILQRELVIAALIVRAPLQRMESRRGSKGAGGMSATIIRPMRPCIAVIGDARLAGDDSRRNLAESIGRGLVDAGYRVVTGGMGGVMEAAHKGAREPPNWFDGAGIGILLGSDISQANQFVDIAIPTGLDHARNAITAHSAAVIAIGGGAGSCPKWRWRGHMGGWSSACDAVVRANCWRDAGSMDAYVIIRCLLPTMPRWRWTCSHVGSLRYNKVHLRIEAAPTSGSR